MQGANNYHQSPSEKCYHDVPVKNLFGLVTIKILTP